MHYRRCAYIVRHCMHAYWESVNNILLLSTPPLDTGNSSTVPWSQLRSKMGTAIIIVGLS